ncbi:MAG TPA: DUF6786 family protein [Fimbriimonadaceae bacterium]|nr:DUF6786 family protein [Fimbriimonadaceae bacterium]
MPILSALLATVMAGNPTFASDLAFLKQHTQVVLLHDAHGAAVAVVPAWQNRVVTSTYDSKGGLSMGFINYPLVKSGKITPHIYPVGGEDRIWFGPEGGQFSLFFKGGSPFDLDHWQTPAPIDTEPFDVVSQKPTAIACAKHTKLTNYSGTEFKMDILRVVKMLTPGETKAALGMALPSSVQSVGFESINKITNAGEQQWNEQTGEVSVWILAMLKHSATTTAIVPFKPGPVESMGPLVNDTYFGKVPADRLKIHGNAAFFKCDGQKRTKIGVNANRALDVVGSFDPKRNLLTVMKFTRPHTTKYVNSMWEIQKDPFGGDVVNSYNDGIPGPGKKPLGPFYEIEDSSPALGLGPHETATHISRTFHIHGPLPVLRAIAKKVLGVDISPAG